MTDRIELTEPCECSALKTEGLRAFHVETVRYRTHAPTQRRLGTLASVPLFAALGPADVRALDSRCIWRRVNAGDWIAAEQSEATDVYFVVSGRAHVRSARHSASKRSRAGVPRQFASTASRP